MYKQRYRISLLLLVMSLTFVGMISQTLADDSSTTCPAGQGYWKNTPTWPVTQLMLGSQNYSQVEVLIILNTPPQGDASLILAHQLIAAKLNAANGKDTNLVAGVITQGDTVLAGYTGRLPYNVPPADANGQTLVNLSTILASYNEGQLTLGCTITATPTPTGTLTITPATATVMPTATLTTTPATATPQGTPAPTLTITPTTTSATGTPVIIVIEGPVQIINVNIITIYNINIQLDDDDPNLKIIQVGDIVRVSGSPQGNTAGSITIIAVTVVIINVDVNVSTGDVWRDDNSCSNPPPPWAPANGWRRRCEGNNNNNGNGNGNNGNHGNNNKHNDDDDDDDD